MTTTILQLYVCTVLHIFMCALSMSSMHAQPIFLFPYFSVVICSLEILVLYVYMSNTKEKQHNENENNETTILLTTSHMLTSTENRALHNKDQNYIALTI